MMGSGKGSGLAQGVTWPIESVLLAGPDWAVFSLGLFCLFSFSLNYHIFSFLRIREWPKIKIN
jgi:hypothetical protein